WGVKKVNDEGIKECVDQDQTHCRRDQRKEDLENPNIRHFDKAQRAITRAKQRVTVFPEALQRAIRPAKSLLRQHAQGLRRFGPADCGFFVSNLVATLAYLQREILIFGERVRAEAAAFENQFPSPGTDGARYDSDAVQAGKGATIHVL